LLLARVPSLSRAKDIIRKDTIIEKEADDDWLISEST